MSTDSLVGRTDAREVDPLDLVSPKRYGQSGPPHALWHMMRHHDPVHWCEPEGFPESTADSAGSTATICT